MGTGIKRAGSRIQKLIDRQLDLIEAEVEKNPYSMLSVELMREMRQLQALYASEARLTDGKPTAIQNGTVTHRVELPAGVKHYGVDPPGPGVVEVEHKPTESKQGYDDDNDE